MSYVATINTPGYLPTDDDPPTFDTAREAWDYLTAERVQAEDEAPEWADHACDFPADCEYSETMLTLAQHEDAEGTVYGQTPGYDGDHDLGLAYCVIKVEES